MRFPSFPLFSLEVDPDRRELELCSGTPFYSSSSLFGEAYLIGLNPKCWLFEALLFLNEGDSTDSTDSIVGCYLSPLPIPEFFLAPTVNDIFYFSFYPVRYLVFAFSKGLRDLSIGLLPPAGLGLVFGLSLGLTPLPMFEFFFRSVSFAAFFSASIFSCFCFLVKTSSLYYSTISCYTCSLSAAF